MDTKPTRKKPLVGPRIKSRTLNSFEVDNTDFTEFSLFSDDCRFCFFKVFKKSKKNSLETKQAGVVVLLKNKAENTFTEENFVENTDIMEITCLNGVYIERDFEGGKYIVRSTITKKQNPVLFDSIMTDLIKIKNTVTESRFYDESIKNELIGDPTKRVRIDITAECEYLRKDDEEDYTYPDILTALKFHTFVEDV